LVTIYEQQIDNLNKEEETKKPLTIEHPRNYGIIIDEMNGEVRELIIL